VTNSSARQRAGRLTGPVLHSLEYMMCFTFNDEISRLLLLPRDSPQTIEAWFIG
jgi:hypothetical protein